MKRRLKEPRNIDTPAISRAGSDEKEIERNAYKRGMMLLFCSSDEKEIERLTETPLTSLSFRGSDEKEIERTEAIISELGANGLSSDEKEIESVCCLYYVGFLLT